jgi:hypothetical protein
VLLAVDVSRATLVMGCMGHRSWLGGRELYV